MPDTSKIWLEVTNVRISGNNGEQKEKVEIQVKGDRGEHEPEWWNVNESAYTEFDKAEKAYRTLSENLDRKRIVLAGLGPAKKTPEFPPGLECTAIRIQYAESPSR